MNDDVINLQYTTIKTPLPKFIYDGLREYCDGANAYRPQPIELIEKIAKKHKVPVNMVFLTAGIDEGIQLLAKAYGQNSFVFTPAYIVYSDVEVLGGKLTRIDSITGNEFAINPAKLPGASLIFLANPNNPSGFTEKETVMTLVKNNPGSIVVIDEAYGEFADLSVIDQIIDFKHLVVLRSFSKAYGMAGNRIGYTVAHPEVIAEIKKFAQWSNVSYLSVGAASIALDHEDYFEKMRKDIGKRRDEFVKFARDDGYVVGTSLINAVLFKFVTEIKANEFVEHLNKSNIVVSQGNGNSNMGVEKTFVRIAIGTEEQMEIVKKVILKFHPVAG